MKEPKETLVQRSVRLPSSVIRGVKALAEDRRENFSDVLREVMEAGLKEAWRVRLAAKSHETGPTSLSAPASAPLSASAVAGLSDAVLFTELAVEVLIRGSRPENEAEHLINELRAAASERVSETLGMTTEHDADSDDAEPTRIAG